MNCDTVYLSELEIAAVIFALRAEGHDYTEQYGTICRLGLGAVAVLHYTLYSGYISQAHEWNEYLWITSQELNTYTGEFKTNAGL